MPEAPNPGEEGGGGGNPIQSPTSRAIASNSGVGAATKAQLAAMFPYDNTLQNLPLRSGNNFGDGVLPSIPPMKPHNAPGTRTMI